MFIKSNNRFLASFIHLCISIAIFSLFIFMLLQFWYPAPFFSASGGWQGLRIVGFIDIILGPILTLIVFSPTKPKKELLTDLSMIAALQFSALCWGIYTVSEQRPVAVAFLDYSFYTVPAKVLLDQGIDLQQLNQFGDSLPVYVFVDRPQDLNEFKQDTVEKNIPSFHNFNYYKPISEHVDDIYRHNLNIHQIMSHNSEMKAEIMAIMNNYPDPIKALDKHHYIGLVSRYRNIVLIFDDSNKIVGYASAPEKDL